MRNLPLAILCLLLVPGTLPAQLVEKETYGDFELRKKFDAMSDELTEERAQTIESRERGWFEIKCEEGKFDLSIVLADGVTIRLPDSVYVRYRFDSDEPSEPLYTKRSNLAPEELWGWLVRNARGSQRLLVQLGEEPDQPAATYMFGLMGFSRSLAKLSCP